MEIISKANETIVRLLSGFGNRGMSLRPMKFVVEFEIDDGHLLFNLLTRELILLSNQEYKDRLNNTYLKSGFYVVSDEFDEKGCVDVVKNLLRMQYRKSTDIVTYTIFPTTDCNARCHYCFELGRSRIPMSSNTAAKVVQYIKNHCGFKKVHLQWFGGEPLYNTDAIDVICNGLRESNIEFRSSMVSNGYLFDDRLIYKAVDMWQLKSVQITLDGTERIYNKVKAYIYKNTNPYKIVLDNIDRLLNASVKVFIRLNMDLHNADDLLQLIKELAARFGGKKGISVYAHHLFKDDIPMAEQYSPEEWDKRELMMQRIEDTIDGFGLTSKAGINLKLQLHHCMADNGQAVTILPDGDIGLCEHFTETEFIGHIDREGFDPAVVASFKETMPEIPECKDCFYYPECIMLKKCANSCICYPQYRQTKLRATQRKMRNEYEMRKAKIAHEEDNM